MKYVEGDAASVPSLQDLGPVGRAAADHRSRMAVLEEAARRLEEAKRTPDPVLRLAARETEAVLLYVSGLTQDEMAAEMGVGRESVRTLLRRARAKYRRRGLAADDREDLRQRAIEDGLLDE